MSTNRKVNLYLAKSLAQLNDLAGSGLPLNANARVLANSSQKLFNEGERLYIDGDEEKAYVVYMRYFSLVQMVKKSADYKKDKKYYDNILGTKNMIVALEQAEKLGDSLKKRYEELEALDVSKKLASLEQKEEKKEQPVATDVNVVSPNAESGKKAPENLLTEVAEQKVIDPLAPPGGVTVQSVFRLMSDANVSVLLMDVRCRDDFLASHIKSIDCINVPAECLKPGTTVNQIEKSLPIESKVVWHSRSTVDYIILLDWKGSSGKLDARSVLSCLKDAITKWDVETVLRNEPLILEGGYEEWLSCYPAQSTNCNVSAPGTALGLPGVPSLDLIDYDVDLGFLEASPSKTELAKTKSSELSTVRQTQADNVPDNSSRIETFIQDPLSVERSAPVPSFDRSTKPQLQPIRMNNAADSHNVRANGDINRLSNQLNTAIKTVNETSPAHSANGPAVMNKLISSTAPPPISDRSTKPTDKVKISNQEIASQHRKLEQESHNMVLLQEKIASEAQALAELMRKKKKIEEDLTTLTQKRNILSNQEISRERMKLEEELRSVVLLQEKKASESLALAELMRTKKKIEEELSMLTQKRDIELKGSAPETVHYYSSSSDDDDGPTQLPRNGFPPLEVKEERATTARLPDIVLDSKQLEEQKRKLDEQRLILDKRRQEEEIDEQLKADKKKVEMLEKAKREAEAERQRRLLEENRKQKEELERKKEVEEMERRKLEAVEQRQKEERDRQMLEAEKKRKEAEEMEQKKHEMQVEEQRKQKEEKERQIKKDEADKAKQSDGDRKLPVNWERRFHAQTGKYYYINHVTKTTQWDFPISDAATASSYKAPLKTDAVPTTSFGGGLSRSHSSPNIAKMVQDAEAGQVSAGRPRTVQPMADRSTKPQASQRIPIHTEVSAAKVRNLQPTWGSVGRGLTGLRNLGNTCYMNSTIQCLSNTVPLTIYFLSNSYISDINRDNSDGYRGQVADEYAVLIKALWSGQYRSVVPKDFRSVCCLMNSMFSSSQHQDSQELLMYLMSGLSEGLNKVRQKPTLPPLETDNLEDEQAADLVWNHLHLKEDSIFADLFQGLYKSTVMCQHCDKKSVKFDSFMYLTLPIPSPTRCSLADCLLHFSKESKLTGDSRWDCPRCRCKRDATVRLVIWRLPPILLIVLKRFHYEGIWRDKITAHVDFPLEGLDMSRYISGPKIRAAYNLFAVSNHYGMLDGGHYTAACRSPFDSKWYKYDDHEVSEMSSSNIKSSAAYMLFYTSMKFDNMLRV